MSDSEKKKRKSKVDLANQEPADVTPTEPVEDAAPKSKRKSKKLNAEQVEAATKVEEPATVAETGEEQSATTSEASSKKQKKRSTSKAKLLDDNKINESSKASSSAELKGSSSTQPEGSVEKTSEKRKSREVPTDGIGKKEKSKESLAIKEKPAAEPLSDAAQEEGDTVKKKKSKKRVSVEQPVEPASEAKPTKEAAKEKKQRAAEPEEEAVHVETESTKKKKSKKHASVEEPVEPIADVTVTEEAAAKEALEVDSESTKKKKKKKHASVEVPVEPEAEPEVKPIEEAGSAAEATTEAAAEDPSSRKKKKKKQKSPPTEEAVAEAEDQPVDGEEGEAYEYQEEEAEVPEEPLPRLSSAPPRIPPPSAPKKAPAGPIKEGPDVASVFSMKPQIKVEIEDVIELKEYDAEEVKRQIDFEPFQAAKPHLSVGKELDGPAFCRIFATKSTQPPEDVIVKFYSNEPPRLIHEASIVSHVNLLRTLTESQVPNILPLLDEYIGAEFEEPHKASTETQPNRDENVSSEVIEHTPGDGTEIGKQKNKSKPESAAQTTEETPEKADDDAAVIKSKRRKSKKNLDVEITREETKVHDEEADKIGEAKKKKSKKQVEDEVEEPVTTKKSKHAEETSKAVEEDDAESKKKKRKSKKVDEPIVASRPEPKVAVPPTQAPEAPAAKAKTFEPDHILVFEALPDVTHYALSVADSYSEKHVVKIIAGVLRALEGVHGAGYMHRAVAPTNVVVTKDGEPRLTGFDMACKIDSPSGNVMASEKFKAPEITNSPTHNQMVDLWGVGALAYFLLTGRQLYREANNARLKIAMREANITYEPQDWTPVSASAQAFCQSLLVKDPAARLTIAKALEHEWITNPAAETHLENAIVNLRG